MNGIFGLACALGLGLCGLSLPQRGLIPKGPAFVKVFPRVWGAVSFQRVIGMCGGFWLEGAFSREGQRGFRAWRWPGEGSARFGFAVVSILLVLGSQMFNKPISHHSESNQGQFDICDFHYSRMLYQLSYGESRSDSYRDLLYILPLKAFIKEIRYYLSIGNKCTSTSTQYRVRAMVFIENTSTCYGKSGGYISFSDF
jgi:hypothetical protein